MTILIAPTFVDVLAAKKRIAPYLRSTPLFSYPGLSRVVGTEVWVKHENHQPVGAFKVRGGINLISRLDPEERERGVICASTGNHGQSVAYAARLFGVQAVIYAPTEANPVKVEAMRDLGATVILEGRNFDEARLNAERLAAQQGYRYIHSGDEPLLIAGVGTEGLEILEECPDIDVILVPIGGGSGAAGVCIAAKGVNRSIQVIGVQSEASPAAYHAWKSGQPAEAENRTVAEGLSTGTSFNLPQRVLAELLDDFILVRDEEIRAAQIMMIEKTRTMVEAAGAAPLAAALRVRSRFKNRRVALVCSGGNVSLPQLRDLLKHDSL